MPCPGLGGRVTFGRHSGRWIGRGLAALKHDEIVLMGEIEDRTGALVEHVGIEAFGPEQRHITLEPDAHLLKPASSPASTSFRRSRSARAFRP